jgi:16S rRNA (guanine966-N2)-methyltransferase
MRVIAGKYRSRTLRTLRGMEVRPTSDRLRESLFNVLTAGNSAALEGVVWLDLYAGTGAVGIEAISRGAGRVYFVESAPAAAEVIRQNLQDLGITEGFKVLPDDVSRSIWRLGKERLTADVVFLDPPYRMQQAYAETLEALADSSLIWAMTVVIAEHEKTFDPGDSLGCLRRFRKLVQGDSALSFYRSGPGQETPRRVGP